MMFRQLLRFTRSLLEFARYFALIAESDMYSSCCTNGAVHIFLFNNLSRIRNVTISNIESIIANYVVKVGIHNTC